MNVRVIIAWLFIFIGSVIVGRNVKSQRFPSDPDYLAQQVYINTGIIGELQGRISKLEALGIADTTASAAQTERIAKLEVQVNNLDWWLRAVIVGFGLPISVLVLESAYRVSKKRKNGPT